MNSVELQQNIRYFLTFENTEFLEGVLGESLQNYRLWCAHLSDFFVNRAHTGADEPVHEFVTKMHKFITNLPAGAVIRQLDELSHLNGLIFL